MQVNSLLIAEKPLPAHKPSTSMLNLKSTTSIWSNKLNLKNSSNKDLKFSPKTKSDACSARRNHKHLNFHSPTWPGTTPFSSPNKIIASIKPNSSFICNKKLKSVWCVSCAKTRVLKTLQLERPSECTCFPKTTPSWKPKMATKSMNNFMISLHFSTKNYKNRSFIQLLWESTSKKSRSLLISSKKSRKILRKKPKSKMEPKLQKIPKMKNGTMFKSKEKRETRNGNQNLRMSKLAWLNRKMKKRRKKWRKLRKEKSKRIKSWCPL